MADFHSWIDTCAVLLAAAAFWRDSKQQELANVMTFDEKHDTLWKELYGREDLKRIHQGAVDLATSPPTIGETQALIRAFVSFETGWKAARISDREALKSLEEDVAEFLSRPLPAVIWEQEERFRHPRFRRFVRRALERAGHLVSESSFSHLWKKGTSAESQT